MKWKDFIIPLVLIIGCFVLIGFGYDGDIKGILGLGAGWAFGRTTIKI